MTNTKSNIVSVVDNAKLQLNYTCKTKHVLYSIADFVGNIMKRGDYNCIIDNHLDIEDIPTGIYMLCIIDGDSLTKVRFLKN